MPFRIYKEHTRKKAQQEILDALTAHPEGLTVKDLCGLPSFHGSRTLSPVQVRRLLAELGDKVCPTLEQGGLQSCCEAGQLPSRSYTWYAKPAQPQAGQDGRG